MFNKNGRNTNNRQQQITMLRSYSFHEPRLPLLTTFCTLRPYTVYSLYKLHCATAVDRTLDHVWYLCLNGEVMMGGIAYNCYVQKISKVITLDTLIKWRQ